MEIVDGAHVVPSVRWARSYLIVGDTLTLVDAGFPWQRRGTFAYIRSIGRRPEEIERVLVTHGHPDHASGAASIVRATGAKVVAHNLDSLLSKDGVARLGYVGVFGRAQMPFPFLRSARLDAPVADGDVIPIHGGIRVIHTPGHTAGSVCFLLERSGTLFSGDTIFSDGRRLHRPAPFPGYDPEDYMRSLERLSAIEFDAVCGGHGEPLPSGGSRALSELIERRPEPPSWGEIFRSLPGRLRKRLR